MSATITTDEARSMTARWLRTRERLADRNTAWDRAWLALNAKKLLAWVRRRADQATEGHRLFNDHDLYRESRSSMELHAHIRLAGDLDLTIEQAEKLCEAGWWPS